MEKETDIMCYQGKKTDSMCYPGRKTGSMCYQEKKTDRMFYHEKKTCGKKVCGTYKPPYKLFDLAYIFHDECVT